MKGLYISFIIKRRRKLDKVMDYFLALAFGMLLFTFAFYIQYIGNANKYSSSHREKLALLAEYDAVTAILDASKLENATSVEKAYNATYKELVTVTDNISKYTGFIADLYGEQIAGVQINSVTVDPAKMSITIGISFDRSIDSQVDYRYSDAILNLPWVADEGVIQPDYKASTSWEVLIDGKTAFGLETE